MYGFIANPTIESCDRPPPANRSMIPKAVFLSKNAFSAAWSTPGQRDLRQDPVDDQDPEDEQDPAPDVRRAERVQQGFEHVG